MSSKRKGSVSRAEAKVNGLGPRPPFAFHVNPSCQRASAPLCDAKSISWIKGYLVISDTANLEIGIKPPEVAENGTPLV